MSSAIDPTKPEEPAATTESVRDNFQAAHDEIEALQASVATAGADATDALADAAAAASAAAAAQATADSKTTAAAVMATIYPVGALYLSTLATNPNTLLGFGTWAVFGAGRVLIGINSGDADFDALEETGGSKTHTLTTAEIPSHTHTQASHNHTQDAHTHTQASHNHTQDAHTHTQNSHFHAGGATVAIGYVGGATPGTVGTAGQPNTQSATATNQNTTATNQATTATNNNTTATNQATTATNNNTGGDGAHTIVQPYIVVAMWKRTA